MNVYPFHGKSGLNKVFPYLLILPALALFVFFGLGPSIVTSILSFTDITTVVYREVNFIGLDNYIEFFESSAKLYI